MIKQNNSKQPDPARSCYLGMTKNDLKDAWYAKYWQPKMAPLPQHITEALITGPQASPLLPSFDDVASLSEPGYQHFENGFGVTEDGTVVVAALTKMPDVTPAMWDWWFGWHGSDSRRYKLWNPSAHLYACWQDELTHHSGQSDREHYIGRTSWIDEYVGSTKMSLTLQFVQPITLGFDEEVLCDAEKATAICGRVGLSEKPIDSGYLIHYIRKTGNGSEMRSRFWLGGKYLVGRDGHPITPEHANSGNDAAMLWQAYSLLVHCAKEMNHLAAFLPKIYKEFMVLF